MSVIKQVIVGGKTYDINDPRVDEMDEVVLVNPATLSVEEFHSLSLRFLEGNVVIVLRIDQSVHVVVDHVEYVPLGEGYSQWMAHSLVTTPSDAVEVTPLYMKTYRVFYAANVDAIELHTDERELPNGKLYQHNIHIDAYMSGEGMDNDIYFSYYSSSNAPITTIEALSQLPNAENGFETIRRNSIAIGTITGSEERQIIGIYFSSSTRFITIYLDGVYGGNELTSEFWWNTNSEEVSVSVTDTVIEI